MGLNLTVLKGLFFGKLTNREYGQDKRVYSGKDTENLKAKIHIDPPEGMTSEAFDKKVIEVAESFGNQDNIGYNLTAIPELSGNCNSSTSTILFKSGITKEKLSEIESEIPGTKWGFGDIKPWTEEEQKTATESFVNRLLNYGTLEESLH